MEKSWSPEQRQQIARECNNYNTTTTDFLNRKHEIKTTFFVNDPELIDSFRLIK